MKELKFPLLTADDIECRVGNVAKDGSGFSLLLYKTARTDAKYLDQEVGAMNWQKKYYLLDKTLYCSIGIYCEERNEWIWKDDCGSETQVEAEKGQSSDATKRSAFAWGIGRELYSAPFIWIPITETNTTKKKYVVKSISYDDNREIKTLEISNEKGEIVYSYGLKKNNAKTSEKEPKKEDKGGFVDLHDDKVKKVTEKSLNLVVMYAYTLSDERKEKFDNWLKKDFHIADYNELSEEQAQEIIEKCKIGGNQQ